MSRSRSPVEKDALTDAARAAAARPVGVAGSGSELPGVPVPAASSAQSSAAGRPARAAEQSGGAPLPVTGEPGSPAVVRTARRRVPELAVGVVLVGLGAIGALMLAGREAPRVPVLVWANDVARGQVVTAGDLRAASIDSDVPVDIVNVAAAADVVGRTVAFDANAGGFVSAAVLDDRAVIPPDFAVVGLRLGAGRYPVSTLAAGDVVDLLATEPVLGWDDPVVVSGVEVFEVLWLGSGEGGDALVSLLVPRAAAPRVVASTGSGPRLVEVAP